MSLDPALLALLGANGGPGGGDFGPPLPEAFPPGPIPFPAPPQIEWDTLDPEEMVVDLRLSGPQEQKVCEFLHDEIERSGRFLSRVHQEVKKYREQYAEFRGPKNFPWEKCSNVAVPMTAPAVNQVVGRNVRVLKSTTPCILVEPLPGVSDQWTDPDLLQGIQDFLNAKLMEDRAAFGSIVEWILESTITGTGITKVFWDRLERKIRAYEQIPGSTKPRIVEKEYVAFEGNKVDLMRTEDIFFPPEAWNLSGFLQEGQWLAQRFRERWGLLEQKVRDGIYKREAVERLRDEADQIDQQATGSVYIDPKSGVGDIQAPLHESANELVLYEVYCRMALADGEPERDLVFTYSWKQNVLLRAIENPYFHGKRPFVKLPYWPLPNAAFGRGIPEEIRHPQKSADDIWNAFIDALTLANTPIFKMGKETGIKPGKTDRIWPGRIMPLDQPDSFQAVQVGNPSPSTMEAISQNDKMAQRASGLTNETLQAGETMTGNRETAQGVATRAGNTSPMFDVSLDQIRDAFAEVAEMALVNFQQFAPKGQDFLSTDASGQAMKQFLTLPVESVVGKYQISIVASSASANSETRKLSLQQLLTTIKPALQDMAGIMAKMIDPSTPPPITAVLKIDLQSTLEAVRQIVQAFEMPQANKLIPTWGQFWGVVEGQIEEAKQAAAQSPPPLEAAVQRHVFASFQQLSAMEQVQVLKMEGIEPGKGRLQLAELEEQTGQPPAPPGGEMGIPGGPMGGPGPGFPPGVPPGIPPMQGGPIPGGPGPESYAPPNEFAG